jgi:hypothetical protein
MSRKKTGYEGAAEQAETGKAEQLAANGEQAGEATKKDRTNPPRYWICKSVEGIHFPTPVAICKSYRAAIVKSSELLALLSGMGIEVVILKVKYAEPPKGFELNRPKRTRKSEAVQA